MFISPEFSLSLCPSTRLCSCVSYVPSLKSHYSFYLSSPVSFPQHDCDSMKAVFCKKFPRLICITYLVNLVNVTDGLLYYGRRKAVKTKDKCRALFEEFHSIPLGGHSGVFKTHNALCARYYWPGMTVDVEKWVINYIFICH